MGEVNMSIAHAAHFFPFMGKKEGAWEKSHIKHLNYS